MPGPFDPIIARVTRRLTADRELQLEIAHELRTQLEDSAADFRAAGYAQAEALAAAVRALGDEADLARQLWQANGGRLRARRRWKRTAQALLAPAAVLAALMPWAMDPQSFALLRQLASGERSVPARVTAAVRAQWVADLTPEQRLVFEGEPSAGSAVASAKAIVARWPDDPVYHGHYTAAYLAHAAALNGDVIDSAAREEAMAIFGRGRAIDPENGLYDFLEAALLISAAPGPASGAAAGAGQATDPETWERAIVAFRAGLRKPVCTSRADEMADLRLGMLPPARRVADGLARLSVRGDAGTAPAEVAWLRRLYAAVLRQAAGEADAGRGEHALALLRDIDAMSRALGGSSRRAGELLLAVEVRNAALGESERVLGAMGRADRARQAAALRARGEALAREAGGGRRGPPWFSPLALFGRDPAHAGAAADAAWSSLVARGRVSVLVLALDLAAVLALLATLAMWLRYQDRPARRPVFAWIGWAALARVIVTATAPAALAMIALTVAPAMLGRESVGAGGIIAVAVSVAGVTLLVLGCAGYAALRRRFAELGVPVPARRRGFSPPSPRPAWFAPRHADFRRGLVCSLAPVVAATALLLGLTGHVALAWQESRAVDRLARASVPAGAPGEADPLREFIALGGQAEGDPLRW